MPQTNFEPIKPDELYDYTVAAWRLGHAPKRFKEKYIRSGKIHSLRAGNSHWVLGSAIIRHVIEEMGKWKENQDPDDEPEDPEEDLEDPDDETEDESDAK